MNVPRSIRVFFFFFEKKLFLAIDRSLSWKVVTSLGREILDAVQFNLHFQWLPVCMYVILTYLCYFCIEPYMLEVRFMYFCNYISKFMKERRRTAVIIETRFFVSLSSFSGFADCNDNLESMSKILIVISEMVNQRERSLPQYC